MGPALHAEDSSSYIVYVRSVKRGILLLLCSTSGAEIAWGTVDKVAGDGSCRTLKIKSVTLTATASLHCRKPRSQVVAGPWSPAGGGHTSPAGCLSSGKKGGNPKAESSERFRQNQLQTAVLARVLS